MSPSLGRQFAGEPTNWADIDKYKECKSLELGTKRSSEYLTAYITLYSYISTFFIYLFLKMRFFAFSVALVAGISSAAPTPTIDESADIALIAKRASITDVSELHINLSSIR